MRAALLSAAALVAGCAPTAATVAADTTPRRQHAEPQPLPDTTPHATTTHPSRSRARTTVRAAPDQALHGDESLGALFRAAQEPPTTVGGGDAAAPRPARTPAGPCAGWRSLVARYFPASAVEGACKRLMCESGGNANARNRSGATGLFQIMHGPLEPEANVAAAAALYARRGWKPWVCS